MKRTPVLIGLSATLFVCASALAQIAPVHDAYVRQWAPYSTQVFDDGLLVVRSPGGREGYVQFLLPDVQVQTAVLRLTCVSVSFDVSTEGIVQAAYLVPTHWSQITWNTKPPYTVELGRWTAAEGNTIEIDVTEAVQASDSTFGIAVIGLAGTGIARYGTLEQGSAASLVVTEVSGTPFEYSLEVTPSVIRYTLPHGSYEASRDAMDILPRMNTYQHTADDIALIVDFMALKGEVLVIPPLGSIVTDAEVAAMIADLAEQAALIDSLMVVGAALGAENFGLLERANTAEARLDDLFELVRAALVRLNETLETP